MNSEKQKLMRNIRILSVFFIVALIAAGITVFPLQTELNILIDMLGISPNVAPESYSGFRQWIAWVYEGVTITMTDYPFLFYGTDWLGYAHIMIAIAFIGVYKNPVRNIWIVNWAMICCVSIIPVAFICGFVRQIPFYWQLIDCSFGVFGLIPLFLMKKFIKRLETLT